ncbi:AraC family transcriptional regulator ligand-binding domain-containing protein, partial [Acinetobacter stercoris]|uniref:AraC family transcriptional regulator ligand-binding domain-containing protein n=1 Tax=Acinetobacter stercoris TaxID=2126983 RepID=UPI00148C6325
MKNFLKTKTVNNGMIRLLHDFCSIHNLTSPFNTETLKENSINFEQWLIALGSVYKQYGKETFGLKLASYIQPSYTGILGYLNSSYETLFQVVNSLSKYIATWYDYMPLSVEFTEREVILSWENAAYLKTGHYILEAKIAEEFLVATMINRLNQLSSPNQIIVSKVEFTFDNCEYHKSHFNCEVIYNS